MKPKALGKIRLEKRVARPIDSQIGPGADTSYRGYLLRPRYAGGYFILLRIRGIAGDERTHTVDDSAPSLDAARAIVDEMLGNVVLSDLD